MFEDQHYTKNVLNTTQLLLSEIAGTLNGYN
jgi:hypothetical protein